MNGSLTPAGEYYASMNTGIGYNGHYEFVPTNPRTSAPSAFSVDYNKDNHHATLTWKDANGELNNTMTVERKVYGGSWEAISVIPQDEDPGQYTFEDEASDDGIVYRIHIVDYKGDHLYTPEVTAMPDVVEAGEAINVAGTPMYLGGNLFVNGDFTLGMTDWQDGVGNDIKKPYFSTSAVGGPQNGPYLQAWTNQAADQAGSLRKVVDLQPNQDYYFSAHSNGNGGSYQRISFTTDGKNEGAVIKRFDKSTQWTHYFTTFNSANNEKALLAFRWLGAQSQFANLTLCRLFSNREEAIADGVQMALLRAQALVSYNTTAPALNQQLQETIDQVSTLATPDAQALHSLESAITTVLQGMKDKPTLDELMESAEAGLALNLPNVEALQQAINDAKTSTNYNSSLQQLRAAWEAYLPLTETTYVKSPDFVGTEGWTLRCGTYTQGTHYPATKNGRTWWLAQWYDQPASMGKALTMQVKQDIASGVTHGIYVLQCDAATEHNCLSDQHGYLIVNGDTLTTTVLSIDRQDLPTVPSADVWQKLTTKPIYLDDDTPLEVGFVGSKQGAEDGTWLEFGNASSTNDLREGSWCATGFHLLYYPLYRRTMENTQWGTICLPYAATSSPGVKVYQIAGLLADSTKICLEEVVQMEAGMPYIYHTEGSEVTFYETGNAVDEALTGNNNLRGYLKTNSRTNVGNYVLVGDGFYLVTTGHRQRMDNYTALIRTKEGMTILDSFDGPMLTISETPWNEIADGIHTPTLSSSPQDGLYSIDGRRILNNSNLPAGIYIQVKEGKAKKIKN